MFLGTASRNLSGPTLENTELIYTLIKRLTVPRIRFEHVRDIYAEAVGHCQHINRSLNIYVEAYCVSDTSKNLSHLRPLLLEKYTANVCPVCEAWAIDVSRFSRLVRRVTYWQDSVRYLIETIPLNICQPLVLLASRKSAGRVGSTSRWLTVRMRNVPASSCGGGTVCPDPAKGELFNTRISYRTHS